ncbi:precorrin-2 dehydrogenase/sirohydrochlorin ferrochelatase family protein [Candidatus Nitrosotenuis sp. DW1]|uniref:precorrin-2 dehydrogenase/sirohydrochlorin ferrochelatase family protein n=1 Tax=Candidatus Nitrosotenuis sp. DW1 TaxID=2259672 RepID=UPI0015C7D335|nr:bifunctional precorrin-2 dehydrogenase/sirohydrochlorin ferrochelatase [Candidatus Nitrosotenuis sp. DW1]QLH09894.1 bifunctional precorrin-2 dehydrogenase/sirohydrochlorin ferrochelatase [Candidatus Nitrosotenuis sp. DW1]
MIVDLNLRGKLVIVVGAGQEGLKKVNSLLTQDCQILVISDSANTQITDYAKNGKIEFKKTRLDNADFLEEYDPILVMAATDDKEMNRKIVQKAKKKRAYAYAADDPNFSDFAHPSVINIEDTVQIAISTGGRSPAMARKIKLKAEKIFNDIIDKEDIYQIKLQKIARDMAKEKIPTTTERKKFLYSVLNSNKIKQLLKEGNLQTAQKEMIRILGDWK